MLQDLDNIIVYCISDESWRLRKLSPETKNFFLTVIPYSLNKYIDEDNEYRKRAIKILDIISNAPPYGMVNCLNLRGLKNIKESCYMDSVIFSLFAIQNNFIDDKILNYRFLDNTQNCDVKNKKRIQKELNNIAIGIRKGDNKQYCNKLRKIFSSCPHSIEAFHIGGERDAIEFLIYLLSFFNLDIANKKVVTYGTNDTTNNIVKEFHTSTIIDTKSSIIQYIINYYLLNLYNENNNKEHDIRDFLTIVEDSGELSQNNLFISKNKSFRRRISFTTLVNSPYIIFAFDRLIINNKGKNRYLPIKIVPSQTLTLQSGSRFQLIAIVIYKLNHYTAYFKCNLLWFYYNDLLDAPISIGSFDNLLNSKPNPITNGTIYFYSPI